MLFLHRQTQRRRRFLLPRIGVLVLGPLYLRWLGLVEEADEALILNLVTLGLGWIFVYPLWIPHLLRHYLGPDWQEVPDPDWWLAPALLSTTFVLVGLTLFWFITQGVQP